MNRHKSFDLAEKIHRISKTLPLLLALLFCSHALWGETVLRVCDDVQSPPTLDPFKEFTEKNHVIVQQMLDGLVRFTPDGTIEPALAESWKRIDSKRVRFRIRENIQFHNGEEMDVESIKFSIERFVDPAVKFPGLGFLNSIERVEIVDPQTVDIVTRFPDGLLLHRLAGLVTIVPKHYYQRVGPEGFSKKPVGTGAFRFSHWKSNEIVMKANPHYWEKGLPKVDRLIFKFLKPKDQIKKLLAKKLDIVTEIAGTETLSIQMSKGFQVLKRPTLYTIAASFNISSGPLKDVRVRQALNYAVDNKDMVRYDLLGNGRPIHTLVLTGHEKNIPSGNLELYQYDPERSKKLLEKAGYKNGMKLSLLEVKANRAAKIIAAFWKRVGVDTEIVSTTDAEVKNEIRKKNWNVFLGGCPDPIHHPFFIQSIFLYSSSPFTLTKSKKLDLLIEQMVQEIDRDKHLKNIGKLEEFVNRNALTLFTYQKIKTYGIKKGLKFTPYISGMPYFRLAEFTEGNDS